ncbi:MAG: hypothetical protein CSB48_09165 [Proteobacteria bacterium]|nr:MAG: hypothetical protein CSB48_09165 [Pseudomonadota bacterium]
MSSRVKFCRYWFIRVLVYNAAIPSRVRKEWAGVSGCQVVVNGAETLLSGATGALSTVIVKVWDEIKRYV